MNYNSMSKLFQAACVGFFALVLSVAVAPTWAQTSRADTANSYLERGKSWLDKGEFNRAS